MDQPPNEIRFFDYKDGQWRQLVNFHDSPIELYNFERGRTEIWPTVEHYYQAQKFNDPIYQDQIWQAPTPEEACRLGQSRQHRKRPDWREAKLGVMEFICTEKYRQNPDLAEILINTGNAFLIEASTDEYFWGCGHDNSGANHMGKILMKVRDKLLLDRFYECF